MHTTEHNTPRKIVQLRCFLMAAIGMTLVLCAATLLPSRALAATATAAQTIDTEQRSRRFQQAEALYLSGHLKEAASAFEDMTRAYPRDARVWLKYGNTLTKLGSYDGAATAFETAVSLDAALGAADLNLALVRLAQAQAALDAALAAFASGSAEHAQADSLQHQIRMLLGAPAEGAPAH